MSGALPAWPDAASDLLAGVLSPQSPSALYQIEGQQKDLRACRAEGLEPYQRRTYGFRRTSSTASRFFASAGFLALALRNGSAPAVSGAYAIVYLLYAQAV